MRRLPASLRPDRTIVSPAGGARIAPGSLRAASSAPAAALSNDKTREDR